MSADGGGALELVDLVDPDAHEPLTETAWDADRARAAIAAIVSETEASFDPDELWAPHPLDEEPDEPPLRRVASLYLGAAGVIWALHALGRGPASGAPPRLGRRRGDAARALPLRSPTSRMRVSCPRSGWARRDPPRRAHARPGAPVRRSSCSTSCARTPATRRCEFNWGSPGTMLAAQVMFERTRDERWRAAWNDVGRPALGGVARRPLGAGPLRPPLAHPRAWRTASPATSTSLDAATCSMPPDVATLERRAVVTLARHALRTDGLAQWRRSLEPSRVPRRTQWCHGAPGIVASLASLAPGRRPAHRAARSPAAS